MNVILYGATGMVGQGVLRECLLDAGVTRVLAVGRAPSGKTHAKLSDLVVPDLAHLGEAAAEFAGCDACFFCLGVSSAGMSEADYTRVTRDFAVEAGRTLLAQSPGATFVFVSGSGADSTGRSRVMWARVKGAAENALLALPLKAVFVFRPAGIEASHGEVSRTRSYRIMYRFLKPLLRVWKWLAPASITSTGQIGRAMLNVTRKGFPRLILDSKAINEAAR